MVEGVKITMDEEEGHLRLDCDETQFCQIRDRLLSEAVADGRLGPYVDGIRSILVRRAFEGREPGRLRRWFGFGLIATVLALAVLLQVAGVVAVARWILEHGF